jgi:hypothetical protein
LAGAFVTVAQSFVKLLSAQLGIRHELELAKPRNRFAASHFHDGHGNKTATKLSNYTHFQSSGLI